MWVNMLIYRRGQAHLGHGYDLRQSGDGTGQCQSFGRRQRTGQSGSRTAVNAIDVRERPAVRVSDAIAAGDILEAPGWREAFADGADPGQFRSKA